MEQFKFVDVDKHDLPTKNTISKILKKSPNNLRFNPNRRDIIFTVAKLKGQIIGCVGLRKGEQGYFFLNYLYVIPTFRKQRLAQKLIKRVLARGSNLAFAYTTLNNIKSKKCLIRSGFIELHCDKLLRWFVYKY